MSFSWDWILRPGPYSEPVFVSKPLVRQSTASDTILRRDLIQPITRLVLESRELFYFSMICYHFEIEFFNAFVTSLNVRHSKGNIQLSTVNISHFHHHYSFQYHYFHQSDRTDWWSPVKLVLYYYDK